MKKREHRNESTAGCEVSGVSRNVQISNKPRRDLRFPTQRSHESLKSNERDHNKTTGCTRVSTIDSCKFRTKLNPPASGSGFRQSIRHVIAYCFILFIFLVLLVLTYLNLKPVPGLKIGDSFPGIPCHTTAGPGFLVRPESGTSILLLFHPDCDHCLYQLDLFDRRIRHFKDKNLIFLTADSDFDLTSIPKTWPNLVGCLWGKVNQDTLRDRFGPSSLPAFFVFDENGHLTQKQSGEMKFSKILTLFGGEGRI